uniref:Threonylcarbamoyl-AMP synthase n=1 Tax=Rhabditophanes sp. KR3021 TaxID=114890 RepID=A0AC35TH20_9BILA
MMKRLIKIDTDYDNLNIQGYKKAVEVACNSLKQGKVIAIPTDTIYGVCCSLTECSKIYDIKERNQTKPLGIFVPDIEAISMVAIVPEEYKQLVDSLLPGPCTLLLPRSPLLPKSFNPGVDSVGVRIPDCKFVQDLVKQFGEPIAQTSANKSGASVNPTSEHIDYSMYAVLPMAIECGTLIGGIEISEPKLVIANVESEIYLEREIDLDGFEWNGCSKPNWSDYYLSGWKGILDWKEESSKGMKILVYGNIPPSAGLSSSSSLVCGASLMTLAIQSNGKSFDLISKGDFAELCAQSERYVSVEGGGMDQAIEVLAEEGKALLIDFKPLTAHKVQLPDNAVFAVVDSLTSFNKGSTNYYNQRVVECRLGAQIIAKLNGIKNWSNIRNLGELATSQLYIGNTPKDMYSVAYEHLKHEDNGIYTREEVKKILEIDDVSLINNSLNSNTTEMQAFRITPRVLHCYSEADRVIEFKSACEQNELLLMAALMNESHESLKTNYECSCDELDETVANCLKAGFLGARLTGAGWAGCVVAIATKEMKETLDSKMDILFWSTPSKGIELFTFFSDE